MLKLLLTWCVAQKVDGEALAYFHRRLIERIDTVQEACVEVVRVDHWLLSLQSTAKIIFT